ncbi:MAG: peptidylprolyl isomerase [Spirochaetia bacterium]|nr:peptidylprolyl isomerase [Spirochaetia bacterium]
MQMRASHILVKDRNLAQVILNKLKSGADFASLAREYSTCPSKSKGGDLGWFSQGQMVKPFEEATLRLSIGALSGVVSTQFGFHLIKKTGQKD